jgi:hypothetical protein
VPALSSVDDLTAPDGAYCIVRLKNAKKSAFWRNKSIFFCCEKGIQPAIGEARMSRRLGFTGLGASRDNKPQARTPV